jgi:hypothetical protein
MNADFWLRTDQDDCAKLKDENTCNAASKCSWCKSAAVRSACNSIESAKTLPDSIFSCSKLSEEPVEEKPHMYANFWLRDDQDDCSKLKDQNSCDALDKCSWCKSAAVRSSCNSLENARALPPAVFACDKVTEEMTSSTRPSIMPRFDFGDHKQHHGPHPPPHHRRLGFCPFLAVTGLVFIAFIYFLKKYQHALEDYIQKGGKLEQTRCPWKKCKKEAIKSQAPVFSYSIVDHDKPFPEVVSPEPSVQTFKVEKPAQQMV